MGKKIISVLFYLMLVVYAVLMLDLLFRPELILDGNRQIVRSCNLIPFHTIMEYSSPGVSRSAVVINLLGNIAVFIPYGLYLQTLRKAKRVGTGFLIVLGTSVLIEIIQFASGVGVCDIDDVILNGIGGVLGILLHQALLKVTRDKDRVKTIVTVLSLLFGLPILFLLFATHISITGNRYRFFALTKSIVF